MSVLEKSDRAKETSQSEFHCCPAVHQCAHTLYRLELFNKSGLLRIMQCETFM